MSTTALTLPGMEHEQRNLALSQYYTSPALAEKLWVWWSSHHAPATECSAWPKVRVLEPAAGHGALLKPALQSGLVAAAWAVDIDPVNVGVMRAGIATRHWQLAVQCADFLKLEREVATMPWFHVALMNPPYEDGQDVAFILRAFLWTKCVCGIFRSAIVHGDERYEQLWQHVDIVRGKWCSSRPSFGEGNGARSDFVALELRLRDTPRGSNEDMNLSFGWW